MEQMLCLTTKLFCKIKIMLKKMKKNKRLWVLDQVVSLRQILIINQELILAIKMYLVLKKLKIQTENSTLIFLLR
jgi:hypothetical protein